MEIYSGAQERENPSPTNSPNSKETSSSILPSPKPNPRSENQSINNNPYPTTFVQADTATFKQVVQMLTGSSETSKHAAAAAGATSSPRQQPDPQLKTHSIPPMRTGVKKQGFKLYERRNNLKNGLKISTLVSNSGQNCGFSPRKQEILSPSMLNFPSLVLSPVTPLIEDPFDKSSAGSSSEEDRAIAEKGFYLHPSPRTAAGQEPQLLSLFPVSSPRITESSSG